jgi:hypothetical protein
MIRFGSVRIDRKRKMIWNGTRFYTFLPSGKYTFLPAGRDEPNRRFQLFQHLLLSGGCSRREIFDWIYSNDPDGGPFDNCISVMLTYAKPILAHLGMKLCKNKESGVTKYWVTSL